MCGYFKPIKNKFPVSVFIIGPKLWQKTAVRSLVAAETVALASAVMLFVGVCPHTNCVFLYVLVDTLYLQRIVVIVVVKLTQSCFAGTFYTKWFD